MSKPTSTTPTATKSETDSLAIVKNAGSSYFSAVDLAAREPIARLGDGAYPHTVISHPDGTHAFLLYISSAHLELVDLERLETVDRIDDLGVASIGCAMTPDGRRLFVGTAGELPDNERPGVIAFRLEAGNGPPSPERVGTRPIGRCAGMCIGPDDRLYVAAKRAGELVELSPTAGLTERGRYDVGEKPHDIYPVPGTDLLAVNNAGESTTTFVDTAMDEVRASAPTGRNPHGIAFGDGPTGRRAYVPARDDTRLAAIDLSAVESGADEPTQFVDVGTTTGFAATVADDRYVLVDSYDEPEVTIVDTRTLSVVRRVTVGGEPLHLVVSPDETECYVGNMDRASIAVLDVAPLQFGRPDLVTVAERIDGLGDMPSGIFTTHP